MKRVILRQHCRLSVYESDGQLDIMFNNAGIALGGYFEDLPFEKTRDMIDINLVGVLNGFHAAIPYLKGTEARSVSVPPLPQQSTAPQK